jgi:predicted secreted protein
MSEASNTRAVQVGKQFAIDLEAMPGAGYMWEMTPPSGQVELISQAVVSISKAIGGNSTQRFLLVARLPGSYSLEFKLKRTWEADSVKTSVFTITAE